MKVKSKNAKGKIFSVLLCLCGVILFFTISAPAQWIKLSVNTTASLRGLSVVNEKIVWASGAGGTVIKTVDGGKSWKVITVAGAEKLDFRDIEAFDGNSAYALSIGNGENSRIYKTNDGGTTWKEQFRNKNEKAFFDAIACWDRKSCIAMSDPVDGHYVLISTADGENWKPIVSNKMPAAKEGEAAFAASGTCLITQGKNRVFLVSGGSDARVFRSIDRGVTWTVADTPITKGTPGSGIFSIAMYDDKNGVIVGGNYEKPDEAKDNLAFTTDGGKTWKLETGLTGYRSAVVYGPGEWVIAVGTNGTDYSTHKLIWGKMGKENLNAVDVKIIDSCDWYLWGVGPSGLVVKQSFTCVH